MSRLYKPFHSSVHPGETYILYVEDDSINQQVLKQTLLRNEDIIVRTVSDLDDTKKMLEQEPCWPDLLLLDNQLVGITGGQLIQQIWALYPKTAIIPVVVCTASSKDEAANMAVEVKAEGYLCKPYTNKELMNTIAAHAMKTSMQTQSCCDPDTSQLSTTTMKPSWISSPANVMPAAVGAGGGAYTDAFRLHHRHSGSGRNILQRSRKQSNGGQVSFDHARASMELPGGRMPYLYLPDNCGTKAQRSDTSPRSFGHNTISRSGNSLNTMSQLLMSCGTPSALSNALADSLRAEDSNAELSEMLRILLRSPVGSRDVRHTFPLTLPELCDILEIPYISKILVDKGIDLPTLCTMSAWDIMQTGVVVLAQLDKLMNGVAEIL